MVVLRFVIGAILTQNTTWKNAKKSLDNLKEYLDIEVLAKIDIELLQSLIRSSGFFRQKSKYIKDLSKNILKEYGDFEYFKNSVDRNWLLSQKGIGNESADAILNYACYKEAFVVDSYTNRLLKEIGYEFSSYMEIQDWIVSDFYLGYKEVFDFSNRAKAYARAHGMIVEFCKKQTFKKTII